MIKKYIQVIKKILKKAVFFTHATRYNPLTSNYRLYARSFDLFLLLILFYSHTSLIYF